MFQANFLGASILAVGNNVNNTSGLSSFGTGGNNNGGSGTIYLDISPYMTPAYTSNGGLPGLVDALNSLLCGGQLSTAAKSQIVSYASTLGYTTPTALQMRDRVRAVVHLVTSSPNPLPNSTWFCLT